MRISDWSSDVCSSDLPQPPSFARAMLPPTDSRMPLLLSGTASVVGHATLHAGALLAQLHETLANFDALLGAARERQPALPAEFGPGTRLKVYVRSEERQVGKECVSTC